MSVPVAVIDIGSNSIKLLVATRSDDGRIRALKYRTIDARISAGLSAAQPRLSDEGIACGLEAITALLADTAAFSPQKTILVATSAVRDAANGAEFRERILAKTGHTIRILSGQEEANLIGRGLTCDPALAALENFYVFDLGGGSLECLAFQNRQIVQAVSLQLGCVRLTEKFIRHPALPLQESEAGPLAVHVRDELKRSGFRFALKPPPAVFTGGTISTVRLIKAARHGVSFEETPSTIGLDTLHELLDELAPLTLAQRQEIPGMPPARADVFPAALITVLALADYTHVDRFHHSLYNLRWGLAAELLGDL